MKILLDKSDMTEKDWQEYRQGQKGVGGSDAGVIMGLNPYKSVFTLWLEKTGQIAPRDLSGNPYVEWGIALEPVIRKKFAEKTGFEVFENPYVMAHDDHEFMVANIDGEVIDPEHNGEKGVLEIKTANDRAKEDWEEAPPHHYMLQIQHYLGVMGYNYGYIAVLFGGNDFRYYKVERDDYVIDEIISAESAFMRAVEENIPPKITEHTADSQWLAEAYPIDNEKEGILSVDLEGLALRYKEIQEQSKELQNEMNFIKNRIKAEAKEYKVLKSDKVKINMPTVNKTTFNTKEFERDYPELYNGYKNKQTSYRSFTVSLSKK